jgi:hypothetical protein
MTANTPPTPPVQDGPLSSPPIPGSDVGHSLTPIPESIESKTPSPPPTAVHPPTPPGTHTTTMGATSSIPSSSTSSAPPHPPPHTDSTLSTISNTAGDDSSDSEHELRLQKKRAVRLPWMTAILDDAKQFEEVILSESPVRSPISPWASMRSLKLPTSLREEHELEEEDKLMPGALYAFEDGNASVTDLVGRDLANLAAEASDAAAAVRSRTHSHARPVEPSTSAAATATTPTPTTSTEEGIESEGEYFPTVPSTDPETPASSLLGEKGDELTESPIPTPSSLPSASHGAGHKAETCDGPHTFAPSGPTPEQKIHIFETEFGALTRTRGDDETEVEKEEVIMELDGAFWSDVTILVSPFCLVLNISIL